MRSHADNYGLHTTFTAIALFGASGQIGDRVLNALVFYKRKEFEVVASVPPGSESRIASSVIMKTFNLKDLTHEKLAQDLQGVDTVVSALDGPALEAQATNQDAAPAAGIQWFYSASMGSIKSISSQTIPWEHPLGMEHEGAVNLAKSQYWSRC